MSQKRRLVAALTLAVALIGATTLGAPAVASTGVTGVENLTIDVECTSEYASAMVRFTVAPDAGTDWSEGLRNIGATAAWAGSERLWWAEEYPFAVGENEFELDFQFHNGEVVTFLIDTPGTSSTDSPLRTSAVVDCAAEVTTMTPVRLADLPQVAPGEAPRCVSVAGEVGVPAGATGVLLNVTAAGAAGPGNAVVYPDGRGGGTTPTPNASTVNFETGRDVANSAIIGLGANGDLCVAVQGSTLGRLILDVTGYITGENGVTTTQTRRIVDTRAGAYQVGPVKGPAKKGSVKTVRVVNGNTLPDEAIGVFANVTVTNVTGPGHLKVWDAGFGRPNTSVVNYAPGHDKANGQYLPLSLDGKIKFESVSANADVIIDVTGYVLADSAVMAIAYPSRVVETRASEGVKGPISGRLNQEQVYSVEISYDVIPSEATAVILNVTAVQPESAGHLRVYPDSWGNGATPPPETSTLNYIPGRDIPNMVIVQLPPNRRVNFYSVASTTDLAVDVIGFVEVPLPWRPYR